MLQDTMIDIAQQIQHFSLTIHPQQLKWLRNAIPAKQLSPIAPFFFFFSSVSDTWCQSAGRLWALWGILQQALIGGRLHTTDNNWQRLTRDICSRLTPGYSF